MFACYWEKEKERKLSCVYFYILWPMMRTIKIIHTRSRSRHSQSKEILSTDFVYSSFMSLLKINGEISLLFFAYQIFTPCLIRKCYDSITILEGIFLEKGEKTRYFPRLCRAVLGRTPITNVRPEPFSEWRAMASSQISRTFLQETKFSKNFKFSNFS